jgi:aldehyde dehydrogenase (NAD+)
MDAHDPSTEEVAGQISLGSSADVDRAVAAARRAPTYSQISRDERLVLLQRIIDGFEARNDEHSKSSRSCRLMQLLNQISHVTPISFMGSRP